MIINMFMFCKNQNKHKVRYVSRMEANLDWLDANLTAEERELLKTHTHDVSVWDTFDSIEMLHDILDRIPATTEQLILYSGAEFAIDQYTFGEMLKLKYFTSSYSREVAEKYAIQTGRIGVLFVLTIPKGSKFVCLDRISVHGDAEHECLLDGFNAILKVTRIVGKKEYIEVHADYTVLGW